MTKHPCHKHYECDITDLLGRVITEVHHANEGELQLVCAEGTFTFFHKQDCCESVYLADVTGDFIDLIGSPILLAAVSKQTPSKKQCADKGDDVDCYESVTWTFYKLATIKGYVDLRWIGESNGYYSEEVDMKYTPKDAS